MQRKWKLIVAGASLAVVSAAALVFAAWTTSGTGHSYAKAGSSQDLATVDVSAATGATLYPGATGDVLIKLSNPNPFPVRVTSVTLRGTNADIAPDAGHSGCSPTGVSFTDKTGLAIDVPAKTNGADGTTQATLSGAVSMSNASVDACQGATFSIPVTISGASHAG